MAQTMNDAPVNYVINPNYLLLDTCYTISSITNEDFVKDICACDAGKELQAYTKGIHQYCWRNSGPISYRKELKNGVPESHGIIPSEISNWSHT